MSLRVTGHTLTDSRRAQALQLARGKRWQPTGGAAMMGRSMSPPPTATRAPAPVSGEERELVERLRRGDRAAFATLVDRHGAALYRLAMTFVRDPAAAADVVQDSWLGALDGLARFEGRSSLRTWLFQIVANRARTRIGKERRTRPFSALATSLQDGDEEGEPSHLEQTGAWRSPPERWSEENPERLALGAETRAALEAAIAGLLEGQREVITLRDVEGLETEEICELLGISVSNQRVLLHRARARVRAALDAHLRGAA